MGQKVKIIDFGYSRRIAEKNGEDMTRFGKVDYSPDELLKNTHYTEKVDVYIFGRTLQFCLFQTPKSIDFKKETMNPLFKDLSEEEKKFWINLIISCTDKTATNRPSAPEILEDLAKQFHDYFKTL